MNEQQLQNKTDWISNLLLNFFPFKNAENKRNEKKVFQLANYGTFFGLWPNELWDI